MRRLTELFPEAKKRDINYAAICYKDIDAAANYLTERLPPLPSSSTAQTQSEWDEFELGITSSIPAKNEDAKDILNKLKLWKHFLLMQN